MNKIALNQETKLPSMMTNSVFDPVVFNACEKISNVMATSDLVPAHLRGKKADCFIITQQSFRWGMDPFAVAQCTSVVKGKLCYEGKLVAAVIDALAGVRLDYKYSGTGDERTVVISGKRKKEEEPVEISITLKNVRTDNQNWKTSPDQMLSYRGAREWARRYTPGALLGIYSEDEIIDSGIKDITPKNEALNAAILNKNKNVEVEAEDNPLNDILMKNDEKRTALEVKEVEVVKKEEQKEEFNTAAYTKMNTIINDLTRAYSVDELNQIYKDNKTHIDAFEHNYKNKVISLFKDRKAELNGKISHD